MAKMNIEELKTLIANSIREENLQNSLPQDAVERIKNKILNKRDEKDSDKIPEVVSELDVPTLQTNTDDRVFPDESQISNTITGGTIMVNMPAGSFATEQPSEPVVANSPELPEPLKKAAPAELFVFQYNDVGESGENLSFKPMRLMDDPDVKKSMHDLWMDEAKTKAKVFVAKFEEIGEIEYNYADGTSKFVEKASTPDYEGGPEYKENPYAAESLPQIDAPTQDNLETYIKNSVDLEKVVHDIVMGIVKDSLLTNSEKAINEDIHDTETQENNGYSIAQAVKPMEESESKEDEQIIFTNEGVKLDVETLVKSEEFERVVLPEELNENINSGDKSMLKSESNGIQVWEFEGSKYYTQVGRISKNKGYIQK